MAKMVECKKVTDVDDCAVVIRAETEPEVIRMMAEHAQAHQLTDSAQQLAMKTKVRIRDG